MTVYEVVLEGRQAANDMLNVLHYDDGGSGPPTWTDFAAVWEGHLIDHLQPYCGTRVSWQGITYRIDSPGQVGVFVPLPGGVLVGTDDSGDQSDASTMFVKKLSLGAVRPTYGWFMQGGISVHHATGGSTWEASVLAEVAAYAENMRVLNLAGGVNLQMVIKASNPTAPNTQPYSVVNTFAIKAALRTQRSRLGGEGS